MPPVATPVGRRQFLDERFRDRAGDFGDFFARDEAGHVDDVGVQIAMGAGARQFLLKSPQIRHRLVGPILQVDGPHVANRAKLAGLDQLVGQRHRRAAAIVKPDERLHLGRLGGLRHFAGVGQRSGDGLLARARLASGDRRAGHRGVHVVGRDHVDQPDLRRLDQLLPIGRSILPTPVVGKHAGIFLRLAVHGVHHGHDRRLEKLRYLAPAV